MERDSLGLVLGLVGVSDLLSVVDYTIVDYGVGVELDSYSYSVLSRTVMVDGMYLKIDNVKVLQDRGLEDYLRLEGSRDILLGCVYDAIGECSRGSTYTLIWSRSGSGSFTSLEHILGYYGGFIFNYTDIKVDKLEYVGLSERSKAIKELEDLLQGIYNYGTSVESELLYALNDDLDRFSSRRID